MEKKQLPFQVETLNTGFSGGLGWSSVALIRNGENNILIDTGGPLVRRHLADRLAKYSLKYTDIDMILFTHLHNDHTNNVDLFPRATLVFSGADWNFVGSITDLDFDAPENAFTLLRHGDKRLLFKDGEEIVPGITAMFTPGHTPGCVSYVLNQGGEKWVFTGDAAKNR